MEHEVWQVAGGSVIGRDHRRSGKNNQDALAWAARGDALIAVVCDGCGSAEASELGARLGARVVIEACAAELSREGASLATPDDQREFLARVGRGVRDRLVTLVERVYAGHASASPAAIVRRELLFTIVGAVITGERAVVFARGDGLVAINDEVRELGPFPGNRPPYIAYALLDADCDPALELVESVPVAALHSLLLATDGAVELAARSERPLPGKRRALGPLRQFWSDDRYFRNPDAVRRALALANRESVKVRDGGLERHPGLLPDDTTLIAIRRREVAS